MCLAVVSNPVTIMIKVAMHNKLKKHIIFREHCEKSRFFCDSLNNYN